jgi:hypothetical protein
VPPERQVYRVRGKGFSSKHSKDGLLIISALPDDALALSLASTFAASRDQSEALHMSGQDKVCQGHIVFSSNSTNPNPNAHATGLKREG